MTDTFVAHIPDDKTSGTPLFSVGIKVRELNEGIFLVITGGVGFLRDLLLAAAFTRYLKWLEYGRMVSSSELVKRMAYP